MWHEIFNTYLGRYTGEIYRELVLYVLSLHIIPLHWIKSEDHQQIDANK